MKYLGGCHCGAVRYEVELPDEVECERCNCSVCAIQGFIQIILPMASFTLLQGEDALTTYTFNTGTAKHHFCKHCGVKSFYIPRSNPDGVSINIYALETTPPKMTIVDFDGQHWEQNAATLAHKSKPHNQATP